MNTIVAQAKKGNLAIQITEMVKDGPRLINSVHVDQLNEFTFKVSIDFNKDPMPGMSCRVSTGDKWDGIDFQNDVDKDEFSWMAVMFQWQGEGESNLEMQGSTWENGDDTDRVHFPSLFISEILVTQVPKREDWDEGTTIQL